MTTIALIGPDGAGKTSIAQALLSASPLPLTYLYMGTSVESANMSLPTSRLAHHLKVAAHKRSLRKSGRVIPSRVSLHGAEHRTDRRGKLGGLLRLLRRISEESYRQIVSWRYQRRGGIVLYDRHFLFDALPRPSQRGRERRLTDRIHDWFLYRLYPRPDLVILLDAPPDVLYERKQEVPLELLRAERAGLVEKLEYAGARVIVDAARPFDVVLADVGAAIADHCRVEMSHG